jgi:hypothetical protein
MIEELDRVEIVKAMPLPETQFRRHESCSSDKQGERGYFTVILIVADGFLMAC